MASKGFLAPCLMACFKVCLQRIFIWRQSYVFIFLILQVSCEIYWIEGSLISCLPVERCHKLGSRTNASMWKEEAAIGHKSVEQLRKRVDAVAAKKRRLDNKVSYSVYCRFGL